MCGGWATQRLKVPDTCVVVVVVLVRMSCNDS